MSPVPVFSDEMIQTSIDSDLGGVIMEAFMDASQLRNGRHIYLMIVLIFLYIVIIINLASTWSIVRSVVVTHNNTRKTMAAELFLNTGKMREIMNIIQLGAMVIADALLVWRCYIVWMKNKWLLAFFGAILLGEIVLIIMYIIHPQSYPNRVPINSFYYITLGVTVIATSMVVYRIITVSGRAGTVGRYRYAIEILVESGIIYSIPLLILGVIESLPNLTPSEINLLWEVDTYVLAFLVPVTGIAPTLIYERVMTNTEHDEERWSQPISSLRFNHTAQRTETHQCDHVSGRLPLCSYHITTCVELFPCASTLIQQSFRLPLIYISVVNSIFQALTSGSPEILASAGKIVPTSPESSTKDSLQTHLLSNYTKVAQCLLELTEYNESTSNVNELLLSHHWRWNFGRLQVRLRVVVAYKSLELGYNKERDKNNNSEYAEF
ncbi:hypothetical protein BDQ17DRAFT_1414347 [Cyathus striatus]|nr:hypothetical protein BDQ17DRAFT_1414347 [Cyathus striatus]